MACNVEGMDATITYLENKNVPVLNVGRELTVFIDVIKESKYLNIEVYDFVKRLFETRATIVKDTRIPVLAIYNLGILLEPKLELNATKLIAEVAKSNSLIVIWENGIGYTDLLHFNTQQNKYFFDFSEVKLKRLQHEI
jgi:hypothetical protein